MLSRPGPIPDRRGWLLNSEGHPDFPLVCQRLLQGNRGIPLTFVAFDLLALDGEPLVTQPASERRAHLEHAMHRHLETAHPTEDVKCWKWATDDKPTFHSLRHTFASAIIAGGADQGHVAGLLGHTDPAFTYKVYVHEFDRVRRQAESKSALGVAYAGVLA